MSIFDDFSNKWNTGGLINQANTFGQSVLGQNTFGQKNQKKKKRPQTMQDWGTYVDGLSRHERDQQYPGMHKDLIPGYEMITGGDPNWGAAVGTGMPTGAGAFGETSLQSNAMIDGGVPDGVAMTEASLSAGVGSFGRDSYRQAIIFDVGQSTKFAMSAKKYVSTGANGSIGRRVYVGTVTPSNGFKASFGQHGRLNQGKEYIYHVFLNGDYMGQESSSSSQDGISGPPSHPAKEPGDIDVFKVEVAFASRGYPFDMWYKYKV